MNLIQINVVRPKAAQTFLTFLDDTFLRCILVDVNGSPPVVDTLEVERALRRIPTQTVLCEDLNLVPGDRRDRLTDYFFTQSLPIGGCRIYRGYAGINRRSDGADGLCSFRPSPHPSAHGPGAKRDG